MVFYIYSDFKIRILKLKKSLTFSLYNTGVKVIFQMVPMAAFCTEATYGCATRAHRIICTLVPRVHMDWVLYGTG